MGNSASGEDGEEYYEDDEDEYAKQFDGIETLGYRVLGVQPDSPASKAGLVSFFDFIVGANHEMLLGSGEKLQEGEEYDDVDFPTLLRENIHKPVLLLVYNIKARDQRVVELVPSDDWGGAGLLGVTIKLDDYGGADERLVRVLEVDDVDNGPAKLVGLIPQEDFLLGTTATTLTNTDVLASLLHHHLGGVVELYVYNSTTDLVRVIGLHPTYSWGNRESMLGAAVGTGYLHRLPESCRSTIGKSVERTVSIVPINSQYEDGPPGSHGEDLSASNVRMEPTLEMEASEDAGVDGDVGLAARGVQVQPHSLGTPEFSTPQATVKKDPPSSADRAPPQPDNSQSAMPPTPTQPEPTCDAPVPPPSETANEASELFAQPPPPASPEAAAVPAAQQPPPSAFPEAAPVPAAQQQQPPPPPPPPPPPAVASPPPPPPPPPRVPDPPSAEDGEEEEYTDDEEGSEYTDDEEGSEYTDDEEPETPDQPKRGFFGFTAPPPKMTY